MKKILASMLSAAIVSAMLLTGCGSSGQRAGADASAAGSTPPRTIPEARRPTIRPNRSV